ncbi:MAG: cache domain-containing protein [Comamonadaceae bacterium]|nr:cache domain-containing protein [Comamonadaceae bacterium]
MCDAIWLNGDIAGMVVMQNKALDFSILSETLKRKKYFDDGFVSLIRNDGYFLYHPELQGLQANEYSFFKQLLKSNAEQNKIEFLWPNNESGKTKFLKKIQDGA